MILVDCKKIMAENRPFYEKIRFLVTLAPLGQIWALKFLTEFFEFFKAHIKRQLLAAMPYQESNFNFFA